MDHFESHEPPAFCLPMLTARRVPATLRVMKPRQSVRRSPAGDCHVDARRLFALGPASGW